MKKALFKWIVMAFLLVCVLGINTSKAQGSVSLQVFYDELQPYGNWMDYGNFGYVWVPNVGRDFVPYATNGYWINTEYGNTWVSDYSWGWAAFHYGRWYYDDYYGWIWIPDTQWGPAWVAWRSGGGYYGWAPLMPGFNINVSFNYYNNIPHSYWSFCPYRYITYRTVYHHCVPRPQVVNIINNTTIVTHNHYDNHSRSTYFTGPSRSEIERINREHVEVYKVSEQSRPGRPDFDRGTVSIYKPRVEGGEQGRNRPAPSRVTNDDRGRNQNELLESRSQRPSEREQPSAFDHSRSNNRESFPRPDRANENENRFEPRQHQPVERNDQRRDFNPSDRSQPVDGGNRNREIQMQREMNRDQQRSQPSRTMEQRSESRPTQREQPSQSRTYERPQQHSVDRQPASRQSPQHERPSMNRSEPSRSQSQHEPQMRRSSSEHQSSQPSRSGGGSRGHSNHD